MEILEIVILVGAWIFTIIWMYGVRVKPVIVSTSLVSLSILTLTSVFTFSDMRLYHLLWAIPITMFAGVRVFIFITLHIPILNTIVITIGKIYTEILRIGLSKEKRQEMSQEYRKEMSGMLHDLSKKKLKEIKKDE